MGTFNQIEYENSMLSMKNTPINPLTGRAEGMTQWVRSDTTAQCHPMYKPIGEITILL